MRLEQRERGYWWPTGAKQAKLRYWEHASDMQLAVSLCVDRDIVVQAGGHIGMWPLWLSSRFKRVYTFEPEPRNFECLKRNLKGVKNVTMTNAVLTDSLAPVELRIANSTGGHNIKSKGEGNAPGKTQAVTIDSLNLAGCDFIMLDIEGHELPALVGGLETIKKYRPVIQLENRGHGVKKGRGDTYQHIVEFLLALNYHQAGSARNDVVWSWAA